MTSPDRSAKAVVPEVKEQLSAFQSYITTVALFAHQQQMCCVNETSSCSHAIINVTKLQAKNKVSFWDTQMSSFPSVPQQ